ncbi:MAG: 3-dehydroquinate dehydratase [Chloroflexi bacterium]|nr:MAG: 3-dehydroquinate dehydratase [Chloroflexota bacterium]TME15533.1 MAG: 3-dehydroquinate dehydratase [Chloroflexota bacterium]TME18281.1 MAG: 3-dehydroquinate dehydratase [Chloroflexota bacterium]
MKGRRVVVANGPNLNTLGTREPEIYGLQTLADIQAMVDAKAHDLGWTADFFQSNHEGELVDRLQRTPADAVGVIINPAGLTHYSIALYDCLRALPVPIVEVHLSNLFARKESYRQTSVTAPAAAAVITGMGSRGYVFAMEYLSGLYE